MKTWIRVLLFMVSQALALETSAAEPIDEERDLTMSDLSSLLQQGLPDGNVLSPGKCYVNQASFIETDDDGQPLPYQMLRLNISKSFFLANTTIMTTVFQSEVEQPKTQFSWSQIKHWGKPVTELKYVWKNPAFGQQALIDLTFGGYLLEDLVRVLFDKNKIYHFEAKQSHTDILQNRHIICGDL